MLVWPQIKDSLEVVLSAPPAPNSTSILNSSCAFLLQNASCVGLASGTAPKLAPAFKQIHSSFLSAGAEGGGYYPRVEMSSNGRRPRSVCTRIPVTSPSLTSRPGLKLDQFKKNFLRTSSSHLVWALRQHLVTRPDTETKSRRHFKSMSLTWHSPWPNREWCF